MIKKVWKNIIVSFFVIFIVLAVFPSSLIEGGVRYIHFGINILFVANIVALIGVAFLAIYKNRGHFGLFKSICCFALLILANVMGSFALYFYMKSQGVLNERSMGSE